MCLNSHEMKQWADTCSKIFHLVEFENNIVSKWRTAKLLCSKGNRWDSLHISVSHWCSWPDARNASVIVVVWYVKLQKDRRTLAWNTTDLCQNQVYCWASYYWWKIIDCTFFVYGENVVFNAGLLASQNHKKQDKAVIITSHEQYKCFKLKATCMKEERTLLTGLSRKFSLITL